MGQLDGKVAIVSGSSRGIGHFMALELAKEGCDIVVAARSEQAGDPKLPGTIYTVAEELEALGVTALPVRMDVTSDDDIQGCVAAAIERFGKIDALINNAALMFPGPFLEVPVKRLDLLHKINVRGPYAFAQAVLPPMLERGAGTIITISSGAADQAGPGNISYGMTKVAIEKLMEGLGAAFGDQGIRCFGLKPSGLVLSPGATYHSLPGPDVQVEENDVMGRAAVWLIASGEAAKRNGESFYSATILKEHVGAA